MNRIIIASWILLALAFAAWGAVGYGAHMLMRVADERASDVRQALTKVNQSALNQRIQLIEQSTAEQRTQLETIIGTDLVHVIDAIEEAGQSAGVEVKVSNASAGASYKVSNGVPILGVTFTVQATGSYAQVMHAAHLYEAFPIPSTIEYMEVERIQSADGKNSTWAMSLRISVLTTAGVSV